MLTGLLSLCAAASSEQRLGWSELGLGEWVPQIFSVDGQPTVAQLQGQLNFAMIVRRRIFAPVTFVSIFFGVPVSDAKLSPKLSSLDSGQGWVCTLMLRRKNKANPDNWLESDECVHGAGRVVEFRLVFSRWYRGGVKSQFNPIQ